MDAKEREPDEAARARERRFEEEYVRALPAIVAWGRLRFAGRPGFELDDLVQETWSRALAAYPRFDAARASFRTWLLGIAQMVMLESVRRNVRETGRRLSDGSDALSRCPDSITSISRAAARSEELARLLEMVDALPAEERQLVLLHGLEERSFDEVAARLGIRPDAAAKRWERLRARLRTLPGFGGLFETWEPA